MPVIESREQRRRMLHLMTQPTRFEILRAIHEEGQDDDRDLVSIGAITAALETSGSNVSEHVHRLHDVGVIERWEVPEGERTRDEPYVYVRLTDPGRVLYDVIEGGVDHWIGDGEGDG